MKHYSRILISALFIFAATMMFAQSGKKPAWVDDVNAAYPERDWLAVVESASNRSAAGSGATGSLSRMFKVDVKAVTQAATSMSQTVNQKGKSATLKNSSLSSQTDAISSVNGLMGLVVDYWTEKDGTVYACARINRKDGGNTYANIIKENIDVIAELEREAAANKGTFEAFECLSVASNIAVLTDSYIEILSVLNPALRNALNVSYGNANTVKKLALDNTRSIVVAIQVDGDSSGRLKRAFQQVFTKNGFRTQDTASAGAYTLLVDYSVSEAVFAGNDFKFARYELKAAIADQYGEELFAFSKDDREGHASYPEAVQKALRSAETSIGDAADETSFSSMFNEYLASLLK